MRGFIVALLATGVLLGVAAQSASAELYGGELVVGTVGGYEDNWGGIAGIDLGYGAAPYIWATHANWTPTTVPDFTGARAMAFDANGDLIVSTWSKIYRVDGVTGEPTLLSGGGRGTGLECAQCVALVVAADGSIYAADPLSRLQGTTADAAIFRIDPVTGDRTIVADSTHGSGPDLNATFGLLLLDDGKLAVTSSTLMFGGANTILIVDPATGDRVAAGPALQDAPAYGALARRDAHSVYVTTGGLSTESTLLRFDLQTGERTLVSSSARGSGPAFGSSTVPAVGPDGTVYVADPSHMAVVAVDPATGNRTTLTNHDLETEVDFRHPVSLLMAPTGQDQRLADHRFRPGEAIDFTVPTDGLEIAPGQRALHAEVMEDGGLTVEEVPGGFRVHGVINHRQRGRVSIELTNHLIDVDAWFYVDVDDDAVGGQAKPGDVVAINQDYNGLGQVLAFDGQTGAAQLLSDSVTPGRGDGSAGLTYPRALAVADDGDIYVLNQYDEGQDMIVRVDPRTGKRTLVSGVGRGSGPEFSIPRDMAILPDGDLLVATQLYQWVGGGNPGALFRVDVQTGDRTVVESGSMSTGAPWCNPQALAVDADGTALVYIEDNHPGDSVKCPVSILRVDLDAHTRTVVSSPSVGTGPSLNYPGALNVLPDGRLIVSASQTGLLAIDPATGNRTVVSDGTATQGGPWGLGPVAGAADGSMFVAGGAARLFKQPAFGNPLQELANGDEDAPGWGALNDIAVVPPAPTCADAQPPALRSGSMVLLAFSTTRGAPLRPGYQGMRATSVTAIDALPPGFTLTDEGYAATFTGTPTKVGLFTVGVRVANHLVSSRCTYTFEVDGPPAITSATSATGTVGEPFSYTVTYDAGYPEPTTLAADGLPDGLTFDAETGVISGTPAPGTGGVHAVTLSASNSAASAEGVQLELTIYAPPVLTGPQTITGAVGEPLSFTATATPGYPTGIHYELTGDVPAGLTFDPATGALGGTPAGGTGGAHDVTLTATAIAPQQARRAGGATLSTSRQLRIDVMQAPAFGGGGPLEISGVVGQPLDVPVAVTAGYPTAYVVSAEQLPPGLKLIVGTDGKARITGTPEADGTSEGTLLAVNGRTARRAVRFTIARAPVVEVPVPVAPASSAPPAPVPGAAACTSVRRVAINLMPPTKTRLKRTVVRIDGRAVKALGLGVTRMTLNFTGRPPSQVRVELTAKTTRGRVLVGRRTYRLCHFEGVGKIPMKPLKSRKR